MTVQINIRDVPVKVRDELASRAASQGKSMQEFLREELERLASRPTIEGWLKDLRKRKRGMQGPVSGSDILDALTADRR